MSVGSEDVLYLTSSGRESPQDVLDHPVDLGHAPLHWAEMDAEGLTKTNSQRGLVGVAGGCGRQIKPLTWSYIAAPTGFEPVSPP